ncbi:MAG: hypothetical protein QOF62_1250 [Pyrinomonadaceae bacterium]|nr:hypothetical protein [Pyrinomonadaceae bacterium]
MSSWPRQPRTRQEIPPGYALKWFQTRCACNQSCVGQTFLSVLLCIRTGRNACPTQARMPILQIRPLTRMQRRDSAGKVLKRYLTKAGLLQQRRE